MIFPYRIFFTGLTVLVAFCLQAAEPANAPAHFTSNTAAPLPAPLQSSELTRTLTYDGQVINISIDSPTNPLLLLRTSRGDIILELFPTEAPQTVANFIGLAFGELPFTDPVTGQQTTKPFYEGLVFHRVIKDFMIQGGSPTGLGDGNPGYHFENEISALSLGLDKMMVVDNQGAPNPVLGIRSQADFQQRVLVPLYKAMIITDPDQLEVRLNEVDKRLRAMTVLEYYEMLGYHFQNQLQSHAPVRGVIAMANSGPNSNGSQFFITVVDTPWLTGKNTVFGKIRVGMEVVDLISKVAVDADARPLDPVTIVSVQKL